VHVTSH